MTARLGGKEPDTMSAQEHHHDNRRWGEELAEQTAAAGDDTSSVRKLVANAAGLIRGRLGDILHHGIQPLLNEAASQIRPATLDSLHRRFPGLSDDEIAMRLTDHAARTASAVALGIGGVIVAQQAATVAAAAVPPAAGAMLGALGVTALAEVLVLFVIEAKLRTDLNALAGQPSATPRDLVATILGEVEAAGGWSKLRRRSLQRSLPVTATRRVLARVVPLIPARFARIVVPEVIAPAVGAVWAARVAARQLRAAGSSHWQELRGLPPSTEVSWGPPEVGAVSTRTGE